MIVSRAKEILNSSKNIEVVYNNEPIWIENVNEERGVVYVKNLSNNQMMEVPVTSITETGNTLEM